jgi:hypothetical protein
MSGAEAVFNQALTNGLLAIASSYLPKYGSQISARMLPPASRIIDDLVNEFGESDGLCELPLDPPSSTTTLTDFLRFADDHSVTLPTGYLKGAIIRTDGPRHGRAEVGQVLESDVDALTSLDEHPALQSLSVAHADRYWRKGELDDQLEWQRASQYLDLLDEWAAGERDRRCDEPPSRFVKPGDDDGVPVQLCPVCNAEALVPTGTDWMGYGITAGVCTVCSYRRSPQVAESLNLEAEWTAMWADL